ncbi:acyl carrier protein [Streptomyces sp. YIM 98790]|uniref:acyl carrier protein n=1 Tax=Streptomyces sp. YIM 98790 TaxID=2689077 RepID=UPI00140D351B|nr:acyl carrier protein [Streptomyces sp. YIM 98790]
MSSEEVAKRITAFVREKYMEQGGEELTASTPLIELGILDSLNTVLLIGFIRDELGVVVPPREINAANFRDIQSITALVCETADAATS